MRSTAMTRSSGVRNHAVAGESGKKNLIIRRELTSKSDASVWFLNNQKVPKRDVVAKLHALNVQDSNPW